eukprot:jgi/Mesvir1/28055/Mv04655-RA.1
MEFTKTLSGTIWSPLVIRSVRVSTFASYKGSATWRCKQRSQPGGVRCTLGSDGRNKAHAVIEKFLLDDKPGDKDLGGLLERAQELLPWEDAERIDAKPRLDLSYRVRELTMGGDSSATPASAENEGEEEKISFPWLSDSEEAILAWGNSVAEVKACLQEVGIKQEQILPLLGSFPQLLRQSRTHVRAVIDYLLSLGIPVGKLPSVIAKAPVLLSFSVKNHMEPAVEYLAMTGVSGAAAAMLFSGNPQLLVSIIEETRMQQRTAELLREASNMQRKQTEAWVQDKARSVIDKDGI